ncbi:glycosyltransferase family 2 protein, partial [Terrabacter sp. GCM10028922]|uniref:glycosyltransferase family 2 protein n=1 Tax=Terrabacter sp. GCM10028922 TaxID=3273428 RepID=UPI00360A9D0B
MTVQHVGGRQGRPLFSVVSAVYNVSRYLEEFFASIEAQTFDLSRLQVVMVDDGSTDDSRAVLEAWAARARCEVVVLHQENAGQAAARNAGLEHATGEWLTFTDPDDTVNSDYFSVVARFIEEHPSMTYVCANMILRMEATGALARHPRAVMFAPGDRMVDLDVETSIIPNSTTTSLMRRDVFGDLRFNPRLRPNFEDGDLAVRYLMAAPTRHVGFLASAEYYYRKRADQSSTLQTGLSAVGRYSTVPREGYLTLLDDAERQFGRVPKWVQNSVLYDLSWYFSSEDAMANSASAIEGELAETFRETLGEIAQRLSPDVVDSFSIRKLRPHWRDILLHGLQGKSWHTSYATTDKHDSRKGLVRLLYRYVGEPPTEALVVGGRRVEPTHGKTRRIDFFGATMMWERVLWAPTTGTIELEVNGTRLELAEEWEPRRVRSLTPGGVRKRFRPTRLRRREAVDRLVPDPVRILASRGPVRREFGGAWVLMDRIHDANDSGEILFRWLR